MSHLKSGRSAPKNLPIMHLVTPTSNCFFTHCPIPYLKARRWPPPLSFLCHTAIPAHALQGTPNRSQIYKLSQSWSSFQNQRGQESFSSVLRGPWTQYIHERKTSHQSSLPCHHPAISLTAGITLKTSHKTMQEAILADTKPDRFRTHLAEALPD